MADKKPSPRGEMKSAKRQKGKSYQAPKMVRYGTLKDLTASVGTNPGDGGPTNQPLC